MLPILTFDEARLRPSHGYIFNRRWLCPHETILGIAWKLARMNALPGHIVAKQLALRPIDPYEGIPPTDSHVAVSLLARTFAIPGKALADGLHKTDGGQQRHDHRRLCTACMALACHGVMHQRIGASRCPWHGVALEEHCRGCGAAAPYRLNAMLLGSPFRCAECRRPCAGWRARTVPQSAPPELRRAITRARATAVELTGAVAAAQAVERAVTTLLRCDGAGYKMTNLLRNPRKTASLLGFRPPVVVANGGVTNLVSQL